jgi:DNA topoisomerase VI subunit B
VTSQAASKRSAPTLERIAFTTSRLADFCGVDELTKQCGHPPEDWPLVVVKELVDNALDECEEAGIAPEIRIDVSTERGEIVVSDNGRGLPDGTIAGILDFNVRVSSREAYVSPSRGQQGNALKTILAMAFALDGSEGRTIIESHSAAREIIFRMDPIRREPRIAPLLLVPSDVKNGTRITLYWPRKACDMLVVATSRFLQIASNYPTFNPHLTLVCEWDDETLVDGPATDPSWHKWCTPDPTSAHWYTVEQCERYMAAHIARDQDNGESGRTVRDFIVEFDGLSGSAKQKLVLEESGAARVKLAEFFDRGQDAISGLLRACQNHTRAPKPEALGIIGREHFLAECCAWGGDEESFEYRRHVMMFRELPYVIEVGFAHSPGATRRMIAIGINSSATIDNPFPRLGFYQSLDSVLGNQHVLRDSPIVLMMHIGCPHVTFADRGKSATAFPERVTSEIKRLIQLVTQYWKKQREAELKSESAIAKREERLRRVQERPEKPDPPAPSGALGEKISGAAGEFGVSIDELAVLSRENDPYTAWRRRHEAEWFAEVFNRLVPPGATKHLRGLFYLVVSSAATMSW